MDTKSSADKTVTAPRPQTLHRREIIAGGALLAGAAVLGRETDALAQAPSVRKAPIELRDWAGFFTDLPKSQGEVFLPANNNEVSSLIKFAKSQNMKVRAVGLQSGMQPSWYGGNNCLLISTQKFTKMEFNRGANTVTVGAGVRLDDLLKAAWANGFSIDSAPAPGWMSIGGCIATASHGSGKGSLSSIMTSCTYVNGNGEIKTADGRQNQQILEGQRQAIGLLGIITEVTVKLEKAFNLRMIGGRIRTSDWSRYLKEGSYSFVQVLPGSRGNWSRFFYTERTDRNPRSAQDLARTFTTGYCDVVVEGPCYEVAMNFQPPNPPISGGEYCVPSRNFGAALDEMLAKKDIFPPVYWLKKVGKEPGMLSNADGESVWCGLYMIVSGKNNVGIQNNRTQTMLRAAEEIMARHGGRPHIGKMMLSKDIVKNFPNLDQFMTLRQKEDPDGVFYTDYLRSIFG